MNTLKYYLLTSFLFIAALSFGQIPTGNLVIEVGSDSICEGSLAQVTLVLDDPGDFSYNWSVRYDENGDGLISEDTSMDDGDGFPTSLRLDNNREQDRINILEGGGGMGDDFTFVQFELFETARIFVDVNGFRANVLIEVTEAVRAGLGNTLFLCNQTGTVDLFSLIDGANSTEGVWTFVDEDGVTQTEADGIFQIGTDFNNPIDEPNIFTYTLLGTAPCPDSNTSVIIRPCSDDDYDNDGIPNAVDLDNDNDGILDEDENVCSVTELTPTQISVDEDFGIGPPTQNRFVTDALTYQIGVPQDTSNDGEYNIATSDYLFNFNNQGSFFVATELNGDVDGDGNVDGRFLAINMKTEVFQPPNNLIYEQQDIPVTPGALTTLSMKVVNFNGGPTGQIPPNLRIEILDENGNEIESIDTGELESNDDIWEDIEVDPFTPTVSIVTLRVLNLQTLAGGGNDFGIDNILLSRLECDFDGDGVPNYLDLDSDNDGIYDAVEAGFSEAQVQSNGRLTVTDTDVDADGVPSIGSITPSNDYYLNLDSDDDGCSDANEAYADPEADGLIISDTDFETQAFGLDTFDPADMVDFDGRVLAASYDFPVNDNYTIDGPDTDGNGTPDACEETADNDDDLVSDAVDLDDDNDGILDVDEYLAGLPDPLSESNGTLLYLDTTATGFVDTNADDIDDRFDFDLDGIINQFDVDSDNDGIYDHVEAGLELFVITDDYGQTGEDADVDTDGLLPNAGLTSADTDADGLPNFLDIDADGDGILDNYEAQTTNGYVAPSGNDVDKNGADDAYDGTGALNPEITTTVADYINTNSDDDCLEDTIEAYDVDGDGESDITETGDLNIDGLDDAYEGAPLIADFPNNHNPETPAIDYREEFVPIEELVEVPDAICNNEDEPSFDLFAVLADEGFEVNQEIGEWTTASTAVVTDGSIEPSALDADIYEFVYTISYGVGCKHTFTVSLTILENPFVGDEPEVTGPTVCATGEEVEILPFDSIGLGATEPISTGGLWTSASPAVTNLSTDGADYNAGIIIDTAGLGDGDEVILTYTVGSGDCSATVDVLVVISLGRNPGVAPADELIFCAIDDTAYPLIDELGGSPESDGVWSSTDDTVSDFTADSLGTIVPSTLDPGTYTYEYFLEATDCEEAMSTIMVRILEAPNAGTPVSLTALPICSAGGNIGLFDDAYLIGENAGGTWTDPDGTEISSGDLDVTTYEGEVIFTYTVETGVDCTASAEVVLNIIDTPNSGLEPDAHIFCEAATPREVDLFSFLDGTPDNGGVWTEVSGVTIMGEDLGTIEISDLDEETYIFTYSFAAVGDCPAVSTDVTVVISAQLYAGEDTALALCTDDLGDEDLFDLLLQGEDHTNDITTGGVWSVNGNDLTSSIIEFNDPSPGTTVYTYTVSSLDDPNCVPDTSELTLILTEDRDAGLDVPITPSFCAESTEIINMYDFLTVTDSDGVWTEISGAPFTGGFLGTVDLSLLDSGDYSFTYTLPAIGDCQADSAIISFTVLDEITAPIFNGVPPICEGDPSATIPVILPAGLTANWYEQGYDGDPIFTGDAFPVNPASSGFIQYEVRSFDQASGCESEAITVSIEITPAPVPESFPSQVPLCVDAYGAPVGGGSEIDFNPNNSDILYTFQWFLDGNPLPGEEEATIILDQVGDYHLVYTSTTAGCEFPPSSTITVFGIPEPIVELRLGDGQFSNDQSLIAEVVNADSNAEYEYTLDGSITQNSPIFENVEPGYHSVEVVDLFGCPNSAPAFDDIYVVGFPKFFTPNGDDYNQFWNVEVNPAEPIAMSIFIYDRFGKLLYQFFSEDDEGWDGTFGGRDLPSSDYWFKASIVSETTSDVFTGHFSLKR